LPIFFFCILKRIANACFNDKILDRNK